MTDVPQGIDNPVGGIEQKILLGSLDLKEIEGFRNLSDEQRGFVLASLDVEARAESGDPKAQGVIQARTCFDYIAQLKVILMT